MSAESPFAPSETVVEIQRQAASRTVVLRGQLRLTVFKPGE